MTKKKMLALTLDQLFIGPWRSCSLLHKDSNAPSLRLTTPHFKNENTPRGAQEEASAFAIYTTRAGGRENGNCIGLKLALALALLCFLMIRELSEELSSIIKVFSVEWPSLTGC